MVMVLGHATLAPAHAALCASALDLLAARMGYRDRAQYLSFHMQVGQEGWATATGRST